MKTQKEELGAKKRGRPRKVTQAPTETSPEDTKGIDSLEDVLLNPESLKAVEPLPAVKKRNGRPYSNPAKKAQVNRAVTKRMNRIKALRSPLPPKPLVPWNKISYENCITDIEQLKLYVRHGFTKEQLAAIYGISTDVWYSWEKLHPEFNEAIRSARVLSVKNIERTAYALAQGYTDLEDQVFYNQKLDKVVTVPVIKKYQPQLSAQKFILANALAKENASRVWQDRVQVDASIQSVNLNVNTVHLLNNVLAQIPVEVIEETPLVDDIQDDIQEEVQEGAPVESTSLDSDESVSE